MCGRYTLAGPDPATLRERFPIGESIQVRRRYNVAPGDDVLAVTTDRDGVPRGELLRWGLVPYWAKDPKTLGLKLINARSETMLTNGAFRDARRCLVVADGFYEWEARPGEPKQAWWVTRPEGEPFAFAGLWSTWRPGDEVQPLRSVAIVTTAASDQLAHIHDRMPVMLPREAEAAWLEHDADPQALLDLCVPLRETRRSTTRATTSPTASSPPLLLSRSSEPGIISRLLVPVAPGLEPYDTFLLDLDGCVWVGDEATPRAVEAVSTLRSAGKRLAFVTNDARHGEEDFVRKLWRLGFQAAREEIVTVGGALQHVLAESEHATAFVVGSVAVHRHVSDAGLRILNGSDLADRADVVVVSGHDRLDFAELKGAVQAALRGAEVVCTGRDATFPMPDGPWPGTGAVVAAVEAATGVPARSVGKPEPQLFLTALDRLGDGRALVVGDRLDADVAGARAAGLDGAIVLTGATSAAMAREADPAPAFIATTLADLLLA
jgi:glycerol 3-phosphatase-2